MSHTPRRWARLSALPVALGIAIMMSSGSALAGNGAGMAGSPHDFSSGQAWNTTGEICVVCHAPHDAGSGTNPYLQGKLWNRKLSAASYIMYDNTFSSSIDSPFVATAPVGISALCLSCHDGTVALNQFGGQIGAADVGNIADFPGHTIPGIQSAGSQDMRSSHPISITYPSVAEDPNFHALNTAVGTSSDTIQDVLETNPSGTNMVQCSSCHDVHDSSGEAVNGTPLLRVAQDTPASGLCLTCHIK